MQGHGMSQEQTARALPEQILASSVLKMSAVELAQYVSEQMTENPALSLDEVEQCPICGTPLSDYLCPLCGSSPADSSEQPEVREDEWFDHPNVDAADTDARNDFDPFVLIATPVDLREHLASQLRMTGADANELRVGLYIVDALDEDGYFREDVYEAATSCGIAVPDFERVLAFVQSLEPAGVAARDVRECLLLQVRRMPDELLGRLTAELIETSWEDLAKLRFSAIAERLEVEVDDLKLCIEFMRDRLNPRPSSLYHAPWSELAPSVTGQIVPDVVIRMRGETPVVEVLDFRAGLLKLDEEYQCAFNNGASYSPDERKHLREFLDKARCVLDAVQLRRKTLARIALALADYQKDYLALGPRGLKPLKQKELAADIGIHESTVCRALNGKFVRIPSGEVVPFDTFFDASLPIKEKIRMILATSEGEGLSDSEIARRLAGDGVQIARRTVAKYRDQLRVPSFAFR